ncbi:MAG: hypothetical protein R2791_07760 [Saprospiraceae bacterium]
MKKLLLVTSFLGLLTGFAGAQLQNNAADIKISSGSYLVALNGVVNTDGGTLTVEGTLRTPGDLTNTAGATLQGERPVLHRRQLDE